MAKRDITIDANLPGRCVDTVAGDDVINSIEHGQNLLSPVPARGWSAGSALTVTVNGKPTRPVLADGSSTAAIPAADVSALLNTGTVTVTVDGRQRR